MIIIDAIERIEVAIKTTLITVLGEIYNHDPFWHTTEGCFNNNKHHANFTKFVDEIKLRYYSDIEIRKAASLNQSIPAWKVIEKLSFGDTSRLYSFLKIADAQIVAQRFNKTPDNFKDHMYYLTCIRNICAHHENLFHKKIQAKMRGTRQLYIPNDKLDSVAGYLIVILHYMRLITTDNNAWQQALFRLVVEYRDRDDIKLEGWAIDKQFMDLLGI